MPQSCMLGEAQHCVRCSFHGLRRCAAPLQDGWLTVTSKQKGGAKPGPREVEPAPLPSGSAWSKPLKPAALRPDGPPESASSAAPPAESLNGASSWAANGHPPVPPAPTGLVGSSSLGRPGTPSGSVPRAAPKRTVSAASSSSVVSVAASANGDATAGQGSGSHTGTRLQMQSPQQLQQQAGFEAWPSTAPPAVALLGQLPRAVSPAAGPSVSWRTVGSQLSSANGPSRVQVCARRTSGTSPELLVDAALSVMDRPLQVCVGPCVGMVCRAWCDRQLQQTGAEQDGTCSLPGTVTVMLWFRVQMSASGAESAAVEVYDPLLAVGHAAAPAAAHSISGISESLEAVRLERAPIAMDARRVEAIQVR